MNRPPHKTAYLQTAASKPCKPIFAKELFSCQRTREFLLHLLTLLNIEL